MPDTANRPGHPVPQARPRLAGARAGERDLLRQLGDLALGERRVGVDVDDLLGVERLIGEVEERVDLRHRTVDAPLRAHLAPVEDEGLGIGMIEKRHFRFRVSVKTEMIDMKYVVNGRR